MTVRVGEPLEPTGRANRVAVDDLTRRTREALGDLVRTAPAVPVPGRFGRWLTEVFNDWPEGSREATLAAGRQHRTAWDVLEHRPPPDESTVA